MATAQAHTHIHIPNSNRSVLRDAGIRGFDGHPTSYLCDKSM